MGGKGAYYDESKLKTVLYGSISLSSASLSRADLKAIVTSGTLFFNVCKTVIIISRVLAPASDCEPKLIFLAITSGRSSRSARLLSAGILRSSAQWYSRSDFSRNISWIFWMAGCLAWRLVILIILFLILVACRLNYLSVMSNVRRLIALANCGANASTKDLISAFSGKSFSKSLTVRNRWA